MDDPTTRAPSARDHLVRLRTIVGLLYSGEGNGAALHAEAVDHLNSLASHVRETWAHPAGAPTPIPGDQLRADVADVPGAAAEDGPANARARALKTVLQLQSSARAGWSAADHVAVAHWVATGEAGRVSTPARVGVGRAGYRARRDIGSGSSASTPLASPIRLTKGPAAIATYQAPDGWEFRGASLADGDPRTLVALVQRPAEPDDDQ